MTFCVPASLRFYVLNLQYISCIWNMADSTSAKESNFLKSWSSAETVCGFDFVLCVICKQDTGLSYVNIGPARRVIIRKSVTFLQCKTCEELTHIHCELNSDEISSDILTATIQTVEEEGYICVTCRSQ
jgi:hypothetical protein